MEYILGQFQGRLSWLKDKCNVIQNRFKNHELSQDRHIYIIDNLVSSIVRKCIMWCIWLNFCHFSLSLFPHIHAHNLHYMFPMISIETICSFLRNLFGDNCEQLKIIIQKCRTWNSKFDWLCRWNIGKVVKWRKLKKMT